MALTKSHVSRDGFTADNAYIVIDTIDYRKGNKVQCNASIYKDEAARDSSSGAIDNVVFNFTLDVSEDAICIVKQAYIKLKALSEMASAQDVL